MVICLERGADLHTAQLMPLPLTVSCFSKTQIGLPVWYRLTWVVPEKELLNACVCMCACSTIYGEIVAVPTCDRHRHWKMPSTTPAQCHMGTNWQIASRRQPAEKELILPDRPSDHVVNIFYSEIPAPLHHYQHHQLQHHQHVLPHHLTHRQDSISEPSTVRQKIQDILQDIWKKYRTFDRTSEAYFATLVRHCCISAVF